MRAPNRRGYTRKCSVRECTLSRDGSRIDRRMSERRRMDCPAGSAVFILGMRHLPTDSARSGGRSLRWSSDDCRPYEAPATWNRLFSERVLEVIRSPGPAGNPFRVRFELHTLGPITVNFSESNWTHWSRPKSLIAKSRHDQFVLVQPRTGKVSFRLPDGEVSARPGECLFVDTCEPLEFLVREPTTTVGLTLPRRWLARWLPRPEHCPTLFSSNDSAWCAALCAFISSLDPASIASLALPAVAVAENIATLIALASGPDSQARSRPLLASLRTSLGDCLQEPTLSARKLADRHHISLRTLHYAFADERTTFMQELVRIRLARARELLSDATLKHVAIAEVAEKCGFLDPSHFARRFRRQFGMTPNQYRRSAGG